MPLTLTKEDVVAWAKESSPVDLQSIISALAERHRGELFSQVLSSLCSGGGESLRTFRSGLVRASDIPAGSPPQRLWFGLYPSSVVLLSGETGAGKSSLLYNLGVHAARNEPLWGIPFGSSEPLRVLYLDPENAGNWEEGSGGLCAAKLDRIGEGRPSRLHFHDGRDINLGAASDMLELQQYMLDEKINLCILDPFANLFGTRDENDNAEAARQMRSLVALSRQTGACVLCCHHTGKDTTGNYGRGASARLAAADVGMVFRVRMKGDEVDDDFVGSSRDRSDICRLQIVKNRLEGCGSLFLKMAGQDRFDRVDFAAWKTGARDASKPAAHQAESEILLMLSDGQWHSRSSIVDAAKAEGIGKNSADDALEAIRASGAVQIRRDGRGGSLQFRLADTSGDAANLPDDDPALPGT